MEHTVGILLLLIIAAMTIAASSVISTEKMKFKKHTVYYSFTAGLLSAAISLLTTDFSLVLCLKWVVIGILFANAFQLFYLVVKRVYESKKPICYYDDGTPAKYYITGDKHRNFKKVIRFCQDMNTRRKDVLIVLGDSGFNYYEDERDDKLKAEAAKLNITLFCLHGNKENRPQNIGTYGIRNFCGGKVYYEPKYPNIYFAIDGEIYNFENHEYLVVGGAHSVDKQKCLEKKLPYWEDEMPNDETKQKVEAKLKSCQYKIYGMLTHTCPIAYLPTEMFMSTRQNARIKRKPRVMKKSKKLFKPDIDRSTEEWLGEIEGKLDYSVWFCGHYHIDKEIDRIHMMCQNIQPLHMHEVNYNDRV